MVSSFVTAVKSTQECIFPRVKKFYSGNKCAEETLMDWVFLKQGLFGPRKEGQASEARHLHT